MVFFEIFIKALPDDQNALCPNISDILSIDFPERLKGIVGKISADGGGRLRFVDTVTNSGYYLPGYHGITHISGYELLIIFETGDGKNE
jgi:hypothetical protein